jgi:hypothetical protein
MNYPALEGCMADEKDDDSLAYAELYLMFATLARRFDLEMRTACEDIQIERDMLLGVPEKKDQLEVEAVVTGVVYD